MDEFNPQQLKQPSLEIYLLLKVQEMQEAKKAQRIDPNMVLFKDLTNELLSDARKTLNKLFLEQKIIVQDALNQKLIGINDAMEEKAE